MRIAHIAVAVIALLGLGTTVHANVFNMGPGLTNLEMVTVGDPGNVADAAFYGGNPAGPGSVSYTYNIGKYDVTVAQYCDFLNAVAATDTYNLYYSSGRIQRSGVSGSYTYSVASDFANLPITLVSYWDACRFANWVENGQPTGLQGPSTTETGAYTLNGYNGSDGRTIQRNSGATWAIASEDEWYKAAYYKGGGTDAGYWDYATQSDTINHDMVNYDSSQPTAVGSYPYPSAYGTYDQTGNVWQWNEDVAFISGSTACRRVHGGWYGLGFSYTLHAPSHNYYTATYHGVGIGFRLTQAVPEPSSVLALTAGLIPLIGMVRRRR